jgi:hypothetical protein
VLEQYLPKNNTRVIEGVGQSMLMHVGLDKESIEKSIRYLQKALDVLDKEQVI